MRITLSLIVAFLITGLSTSFSQYIIYAGNGGTHDGAPDGGALMTLDRNTAASTVISVPFEDRGITGLGVLPNGNLVGVTSNGEGSFPTYIFIIDGETGNLIGEPNEIDDGGEGNTGYVDLAVHPTTGIVYAINWLGELLTIDPATGEADLVLTLDFEGAQAIAFGTDGTLYVLTFGFIEGPNVLPPGLSVGKVDLQNGEPNVYDLIALPLSERFISLGFDPTSGLLWTSGSGGNFEVRGQNNVETRAFGDIYTIDPETGEMVLVGNSGTGQRVHDIVFAPDPNFEPAVPTLGQWGVLSLGLMLLIFSVAFMRKKVALPI